MANHQMMVFAQKASSRVKLIGKCVNNVIIGWAMVYAMARSGSCENKVEFAIEQQGSSKCP